jgi:predicted phage baseplate assembly protein
VIFSCCEQRRLEVLRRSGSANAIEFLEVLDHAAPPSVPPQQTLFVRLLHAPGSMSPPLTVTNDNVRITGGARIPVVAIDWVAIGDDLPAQAEPGLVAGIDELPRTLVIRTKSSGDFSRYTLSLVKSSSNAAPPQGFDPLLATIEFSFKVECPSDFDCAAPLPCPVVPAPAPRIDYLAKDYAGFRRLMLDRLNLLTPGWTERSPADVGITLVELLAFAADTLSYRQDVVANEAYLHTARQRISVRRHARLVDYSLHEGCNARAYVHLHVADGASPQSLPRGSRLLTAAPAAPAVIEPGSREERDARASGVQIFETAHDKTLYSSLNRLLFYTWGDGGCCLSRGATRATLAGHLDDLQAGDFLVLIEERSPAKDEDDADPSHRHVVRLTRVALDEDPSGQLFNEPPVDGPLPITTIEWDASDALPFALCISVLDAPGKVVSVALGNIVLADHGETTAAERLPAVPQQALQYATLAHAVGDCCTPPVVARPPLRYRPLLAAVPLTHGFVFAELLAAPSDAPAAWWSAAALRALVPREAMPQIELQRTDTTPRETWTVQRDLLGSNADAADFVAEVQDDGRARLRFGDDAHGRRPNEGASLDAVYRVGNGVAGNVGAKSIAHLLIAPALAIDEIFNPLPAFGGVDPEDIEAARRDAPQAFRTQQRAVTAADYAEVAGRYSEVQRAAATFRWTGSWHTVFLTADRAGAAAVDAPFETGLRRHLERFRMAGYDLEVDAPRFVALDVALHICVQPNFFRADVLTAVRATLGTTLLPDGRRGVFHPDNFTFAQPVYASRIVAAAQSVEGVESVRVDKFQRLAAPDPSTLDNGVIPIGRLEIAQLDNDPNYRDRGRLTLTVGGGK